MLQDEESEALELISKAALLLKWNLAINLNINDDDRVEGLVLGKIDWINDNIKDASKFAILSNHELNDDEEEQEDD